MQSLSFAITDITMLPLFILPSHTIDTRENTQHNGNIQGFF
jgi:hypothetical protein